MANLITQIDAQDIRALLDTAKLLDSDKDEIMLKALNSANKKVLYPRIMSSLERIYLLNPRAMAEVKKYIQKLPAANRWRLETGALAFRKSLFADHFQVRRVSDEYFVRERRDKQYYATPHGTFMVNPKRRYGKKRRVPANSLFKREGKNRLPIIRTKALATSSKMMIKAFERDPDIATDAPMLVIAEVEKGIMRITKRRAKGRL